MTKSASPLPLPVARKDPKRIEQLGRVRTDDYAWMKDENWQALLRDPSKVRPDIKVHLDAENAYTKGMLASTEALQAQMFKEMRGRIKEDDSSVPPQTARPNTMRATKPARSIRFMCVSRWAVAPKKC